MILFMDTETTGLPNSGLPPGHALQPYLVQLAAQLCNEGGRVVSQFSFITMPPVPIPEAASAVHGITDSVALNFGTPVEYVLGLFSHMHQRCDLVVAHNASFDFAIMETAFTRLCGDKVLNRPMFCTMMAAAPLVNLTPTSRMISAGRRGPKPPRLEECMRFFFDEELAGAHDAMVDVNACRRIYFKMRDG